MILILTITIVLMVMPVAFVLLVFLAGSICEAFTTPYVKPRLKPAPRFVGKNKDINLSDYH